MAFMTSWVMALIQSLKIAALICGAPYCIMKSGCSVVNKGTSDVLLQTRTLVNRFPGAACSMQHHNLAAVAAGLTSALLTSLLKLMAALEMATAPGRSNTRVRKTTVLGPICHMSTARVSPGITWRLNRT